MKQTIILLIFAIYSSSIMPQEEPIELNNNNNNNNNKQMANSHSRDKENFSKRPKTKLSRSDHFFKDKTSIKDPFSLRDPFKEPIVKEEKKVDLKKGRMKDGVFTNIAGIEDVPLSDITITGILIGRERRAMAKIEGRDDLVILREGMILGQDKAEIKAILPGGIVLVEKIINVYGQEEYLETIIPING